MYKTHRRSSLILIFCLFCFGDATHCQILKTKFNSLDTTALISLEVDINGKSIDYKAELYDALAVKYANYGSFDRFKKYVDSGYKYAQLSKKPLYLISSYHLKGGVYHFEGDINSSVDFYLKSMKIADSIRNHIAKLTISFNIGQNYLKLKNYRKAIDFYKITLSEADSASIHKDDYLFLLSIGDAYLSLKKYDSAFMFIKKAVKLKSNIPPSTISWLYTKLGEVYLEKKKLDTAKIYIDSARAHINNNTYPAFLSSYYNLCANYYFNTKAYYKAIDFFKLNSHITKNVLEDPIAFKEANFNLCKAYEYVQDYKNAFFCLKIADSVRSELDQKANESIIQELEKKYNLDKKNLEIVMLTKEREYAKQKIAWLSITSIIFLLALVSLSVLFWNIIKRKKQEALLNKAKEEQQVTLEQLHTAQAHIKGQIEERKRLSQDLHDGIGSSLAILNLKMQDLQVNVDNSNKLVEISSQLTNICNEVRFVAHNLVPPDISKNTIEKILNEFVSSFSLLKSGPHIKLLYYGAEFSTLLPYTHKYNIYRILQEWVSNSIKHGRAKNILITFNEHDTEMEIIIEDDGTGFDINDNKKGIGLTNLRARCEKIGSALHIESQIGKGSVFIMSIPIIFDEVRQENKSMNYA